MNIQLDHINMSVENLEQSAHWYNQVFDFQRVETGTSSGTDYLILRKDNSMLCLYELPKRKSPEKSQTHKIYHFGLRIDNPDLWEKKIKELNITINLTYNYPHSKSWYLNDPTGHEIEVSYWNNNKIQFDQD